MVSLALSPSPTNQVGLGHLTEWSVGLWGPPASQDGASGKWRMERNGPLRGGVLGKEGRRRRWWQCSDQVGESLARDTSPFPSPLDSRRSPTEGSLEGGHGHPAQHLCWGRARSGALGSQFPRLSDEAGSSLTCSCLSPGPGLRAEGQAKGNTLWQVSVASAGGGQAQRLQVAPGLAGLVLAYAVSNGLELPGEVWGNPVPSL